MTLEINEEFKERLITMCKNELNYYIKESMCADQYHFEIITKIKLLCMLKKTKAATKFFVKYHDFLNQQIKFTNWGYRREYYEEIKKELEELGYDILIKEKGDEK